MDAETLTSIWYLMGICFWVLFAICAVFGLLWSFEEVATDNTQQEQDRRAGQM